MPITRRCFALAPSMLVGAPLRAEPPPALRLANVYRPGIDLAAYRVSEKFDGVRAYWTGELLLTRGGRRIATPAWFTRGWPRVPLDGELWAGHGHFERAASTTATERPDDAAWRALRYQVFDLPAHPGAFDDRLPALQRRVAAIDQPWVRVVEHRRVADEAQLMAWLDRVVRTGGEGLMLHRGSARHRAERSDDLLKLKPFEDAEARVVAHLPGSGRHAGRLGALLVEMPDGRHLRLGSGFSDAQRESPPPIGSLVTYRHRGHHDGGLPRFATFLRLRDG